MRRPVSILALLVGACVGLGGCRSASPCCNLYRSSNAVEEAKQRHTIDQRHAELRRLGAPLFEPYSALTATVLAPIPHAAAVYTELDRSPVQSFVFYPVLLIYDLFTAGTCAQLRNKEATYWFYETGPGRGMYPSQIPADPPAKQAQATADD